MKYRSIIIIILLGLGLFLHLYLKPVPEVINLNEIEATPNYEWTSQDNPVKIAMISVLNSQETYQYQQQIAEAIGAKMGRPVLLLHRRSYAEINQLLLKGDADIALFSTGAYSIYGQREGYVLLAMQQRHGLPYYLSYVIVPGQSATNSLWELKGKSFAYTDPLSYSGCLAVNRQLSSTGLDPNTFFGYSYFTYSNDKSLRAVAGQFVDGASIDSLAYEYLQKNHPDLIEQVRIVAVLPPVGTEPIIARKQFPYKQQVQDILLHLHEDPSLSEAFNKLMIDRFILPRPELYPALPSPVPYGGRS